MNLSITLEDALARATPRLRTKMEHTVSLLRKAEKLALKYSPDGFLLGMSGGKDSQALFHMAQLAGVKFDAYMSLTGIDPKETVVFVRRNYPEVRYIRPKMSFYKLLVKKQMLPTRKARYCCAVLKEPVGAGRVVLIGIRHQESPRRAKRKEVEISNRKFSGDIAQFEDYQSHQIEAKLKKQYKNLNQDQFSEHKTSEVRCINGKDSILISPIIEWLDTDVWELLNDVLSVPHCELYDRGSIRTGCLFCPMASPREKAIMRQRYPRVERAYKNAIKELITARPESYNELDPYVEDPDKKVDHIFDWWVGNDSLAKYISDHFVQQYFDF